MKLSEENSIISDLASRSVQWSLVWTADRGSVFCDVGEGGGGGGSHCRNPS